jgi:two-component system sensor histidine kinase DesK
MAWIERYGKYFALALLALMWPLVDAYPRGLLTADRASIFGLTGAAYVLVYGWYCLQGYKRRDMVVPIATALALSLLAAVLEHLVRMPDGNFFLIPMMVAGFALAPRFAVMVIAVVTAISVVDAIAVGNLPLSRSVVQLVLLIPAALLFGGAAIALRYLMNTLRELRSARAEIAQHAADRERARIARDLHDLLGHSLSLITLKGELATRLLPEGAAGTNEVRDMLALSRDALQQVREAVSGYRHPTLATELTASQIALKAAAIEVAVEQSVGVLDRESEAVLGWVIREATTNVIRHSGAKKCRIFLREAGGRVVAEVTNDGSHVVERPPGNGLRGLQERLSAVGGTLDASPDAHGGFYLRATIPESTTPGSTPTPSEIHG